MSYTPARDRVVCLPELLEIVFLYLDQQTILISCLLVCRRWHIIIQESPRLQRYLFLLPDPHAASTHNPILAERFPHLFQHALSADNDAHFTSLTEPPLVRSSRRLPELPWLWRNLAAYRQPRASWKRMLVHQPPLYIMGMVLTDHSWTIMRTGVMQTSGNEPRPITMMHLIRWSLQHVLLNQSSAPDELATSEYRVLWQRLPQDIHPYLVPPGQSVDEADGQQAPLYRGFDRLMKNCGIVLHINACFHCVGSVDAQANVLWDIMYLNREDDAAKTKLYSDPMDLDY